MTIKIISKYKGDKLQEFYYNSDSLDSAMEEFNQQKFIKVKIINIYINILHFWNFDI